jgi:hypothetical protein
MAGWLCRVTQTPFIAGPLAAITRQKNKLTMTVHLSACPQRIAAKLYDDSVINAKHFAPL